jgi:protein TonB
MVDEKMKSSSAQYEEQLKGLQRQLEDAKKAQAAGTAPKPVEKPVVPAPAPKIEPAPAPAEPAPTSVTAPAEPAAAESTAATATGAPPPAAEPVRQPGDVQRGDLVTMGAGVTPPRMVRKGNFRYPPLAQRMKKEAVVVVKVLVDENGRVIETRNTGAQVGFGMDEAAVDYARSCTYSAAVKNGTEVKMWLDLKVSFSLGG